MTAIDTARAVPFFARILLAEDDDELRLLVSMKLRDAGFDVTEASDGKQLLERLIQGSASGAGYDPFDMVLSDINMPHFSALDVMVGARSRLTGIPVVLMTALGDAHVHEQAEHLGAVEVIDKPFRLDDLAARLVQILSKRAPVLTH